MSFLASAIPEQNCSFNLIADSKKRRARSRLPNNSD